MHRRVAGSQHDQHAALAVRFTLGTLHAELRAASGSADTDLRSFRFLERYQIDVKECCVAANRNVWLPNLIEILVVRAFPRSEHRAGGALNRQPEDRLACIESAHARCERVERCPTLVFVVSPGR
jgi:hypothetical protein